MSEQTKPLEAYMVCASCVWNHDAHEGGSLLSWVFKELLWVAIWAFIAPLFKAQSIVDLTNDS